MSWKSVRFHNCGCQVFKNISKWVHVLEDQVMKDIIHGKGLMLKFFTPKSFKTWKAKSWIVQPLSRLGDMGLQKNVTFQNLGSKSWKNVRFQNCGCQVLKKYFQMCSCLGRPSHERHNSWQGWQGSNVVKSWGKSLPESFKTWKAKSWIGQSLSSLGDMEVQKSNSSRHGILPSLERKM